MLSTVDWDLLVTEVDALLHVGVDAQSIHRVWAIQRQAEHDSTALTTARCDLLISLALLHFHSTSEPGNALGPSLRAVEMAERLDDAGRLRKALTVHGIICADMTDVGMAVHCYERALTLAMALGDQQAQVVVLNNLGSALMVSAAYADAIECYRRAVEIASSLAMPCRAQFISSAKANIALGCIHLDRPDEGIREIGEAVRTANQPEAPHEFVARVFMEDTYTRLLLIAGRVGEARVHAEQAIRLAATSASPRAAVAANIACGLVEVFEGRYETGIERLRASHSRTSTLRAARRDALLALVMACEHANRIDLALDFQRELVTHSNRTAKDNLKFHVQLRDRSILRDGRPNEDVPDANLPRRRLDRLTHESGHYDAAIRHFDALERIAVAVALREDPSGGHPYRVARLTALLANDAGCDQVMCRTLDLAARLHDIGNVAIPDRILLKDGALSVFERELMEAHAALGAEMLEPRGLIEVELGAVIARSHHERWDGNGYPDGLAGNDIPLAGRLASIAETYDALTHRRPHRPSFGWEEALAIVSGLAGSAFDPELVDLFVPLIRSLPKASGSLDELLEAGARSSRYLASRRAVSELLQQAA